MGFGGELLATADDLNAVRLVGFSKMEPGLLPFSSKIYSYK
jgi:hypothetical protein